MWDFDPPSLPSIPSKKDLVLSLEIAGLLPVIVTGVVIAVFITTFRCVWRGLTVTNPIIQLLGGGSQEKSCGTDKSEVNTED